MSEDKTKKKSLRRDGSYRIFRITRKQKDDDEDDDEENTFEDNSNNENSNTVQKTSNLFKKKSIKFTDQNNQWKRKSSKTTKSDNKVKRFDDVNENTIEEKTTLKENNNQSSTTVNQRQIDSTLSKIPTVTEEDIFHWSDTNLNNSQTEDEILNNLLSRANDLEKNEFGTKISPEANYRRKRKRFISIGAIIIGLIIIIIIVAVIIILITTRKLSNRDQKRLSLSTSISSNS
ncbi:unnamed protein product [Didymodactylos carnosus]|uniref:Uncharacterized protein n=1 Tax=Didymodactylos carnosus TaxID=1234261 RepID=A0A813URM8_9BILA|nr:unnamed protein product [Didymodactylos carnosus]CAF0827386.1 unnamed protein product [Didymodactylos carnosus]CAF3595409.1 unnamed protein product [Didymodactylos carnosus]CAF3614352.1 unnamed protein product [Didymodactylos carnosus]